MKDQISALMDGEADIDDAEYLLKALRSDGEVHRCWATYHMIGDAMRGEAPLSPGFHTALMDKIDAEPTVLAPRVKRKPHKPAFWMTAVASVSAVAFVGWIVLQQQTHGSAKDLNAGMVARNAVSPEAVSPYLLAHQSTVPGSGMQAAYYVRPVALSESER